MSVLKITIYLFGEGFSSRPKRYVSYMSVFYVPCLDGRENVRQDERSEVE